jgi:hypothetical protein
MLRDRIPDIATAIISCRSAVDDAIDVIEAAWDPEQVLGPVIMQIDSDGQIVDMVHVEPKMKFSKVGREGAEELRKRGAVACAIMTPVWATLEDDRLLFNHMSHRNYQEGQEFVLLAVSTPLAHGVMTREVTRSGLGVEFGEWTRVYQLDMPMITDLVKGVCPQG